MKMVRIDKVALLAVTAFGLAACQTTGYQPVSDRLPSLTLAFADASWNGKTIPVGQHCRQFGGNGATPALRVSGIPAGANAVIVEFNDLSFPQLSTDGGHGKIGFWVSGETATLPPVPGGTDEMPSGTFLEANNRGTGGWTAAGYLPPCSGGRGNLYAADVKAVYKPTKDGEQGRLLATGKIELGRY